jgi:hypothetical protein
VKRPLDGVVAGERSIAERRGLAGIEVASGMRKRVDGTRK